MKVYINRENGKTLISKEAVELQGFEELIASSTDAAKEKHVPVVTKKCKQVKVDVGSVAHPMSSEHLIEWVAIETAQGIQVKYLTADSAPVCSFSLADGDSFVKAYAYCNLHGLWSN